MTAIITSTIVGIFGLYLGYHVGKVYQRRIDLAGHEMLVRAMIEAGFVNMDGSRYQIVVMPE